MKKPKNLFFAPLLWLIALGTVDVASAQTSEELTTQCQQGNAEACFNLGVAYDNGTGLTQDAVKAVALYQRACDAQHAKGCFNLGVSYRYGEGVRQSDERARKFYGKACDLHSERGCQDYARLKTPKK